MQKLTEQRFTGERALFGSRDLRISDSIFADGESPLKESENIKVSHSSFQWKYPFWYGKNITVKESTFTEGARAGIWYTDSFEMEDCLFEAPKGFRRMKGLSLRRVSIPNAEETLWNCTNVTLQDVNAKGDYFGMNCSNVKICGFSLAGNYSFDGCQNLEVHNAKMISKDAFWNCKNVTVYDSQIFGEYIGWNTENLTLINCTVESLQGFCYVKNLVLKNCKLLNTTLAFEYSTVDVEVTTEIESVKNPAAGIIRAKEIGELILDEEIIDPNKIRIITEKKPR